MSGLSELAGFDRCVCALALHGSTAADVATIPINKTKAVNLLFRTTGYRLFTPHVIACSLLNFVAIHECA
jgi:hypothetical protein